jgi:hypothetical protein
MSTAFCACNCKSGLVSAVLSVTAGGVEGGGFAAKGIARVTSHQLRIWCHCLRIIAGIGRRVGNGIIHRAGD